MNSYSAVSPEVLVTNFQRRFTGVSATADAVVSRQSDEYEVRLVGRPLPLNPEALTFREAIFRSRRPPSDRPFVIWHVRRNLEMAAGDLCSGRAALSGEDHFYVGGAAVAFARPAGVDSADGCGGGDDTACRDIRPEPRRGDTARG